MFLLVDIDDDDEDEQDEQRRATMTTNAYRTAALCISAVADHRRHRHSHFQQHHTGWVLDMSGSA